MKHRQPLERPPEGAAQKPGERAQRALRGLGGRGPLPWLWFAALGAALLWLGSRSAASGELIPYSEFKAHVARAEVRDLRMGETEIVGSLVVANASAGAGAANEGTRPGTAFRTVRVDDAELVKELDASGVTYAAAHMTPGMAGADLANVVNEAALLAADRNAGSIAQKDLLEAVESSPSKSTTCARRASSSTAWP